MKYIKYLINYLFSFGYDLYFFLFSNVRSRVQGLNYYKKSKKYPLYLQEGNMSVAIQDFATKYCVGKGLDIGAGQWVFEGARAIENNENENALKINEIDNSLDYVYSSHSLEHIKDWKKALAEWARVLKPNGIIFLYLRHQSCQMWSVKVNKQHLWMPTTFEVINVLKNDLKMTVEANTFMPDGFLSFVVVAKK
ncbi:MAG: class I SAM-dependent methyltransferase [bacterium]